MVFGLGVIDSLVRPLLALLERNHEDGQAHSDSLSQEKITLPRMDTVSAYLANNTWFHFRRRDTFLYSVAFRSWVVHLHLF